MKSRKKAASRRHRSLLVEPLESRVVLAGNVRAFITGGTLHLDGDSRANEIFIEQTRLNQFIVSSRDGSTTINGRTGPITFRNADKNLDIDMRNGADVVEIVGSPNDAVTVRNRLFINTGSGADQVLLTNVHAIGLHLDTGSGRDLINIGEDGAADGTEITKEAIILTGSGQDEARIANSLFKRFVVVDMGSSNDETTLQDTTVRKRSTFIGGSGFDIINRENNKGNIKFISYERTRRNVNTQPPLAVNAVDDAASIIEDATPNTVSGNVLSNDTGGTGTRTVTAVNGANGSVGQMVNGQFGTFVINANGSFTYTLNNSNATVNALNSGQTLTDSMNYTAGDGSTTDTATLRITIQGTTELNAVNDTGTVIEDANPNTATGNVLTNDEGGAGTKTVTAVEGGTVGQTINGQFGTFVINANGTFTYTLNNSNATVNALNSGQMLTDDIDYTATAGLATDTGTLTITIQGNTDGPVVAVDDTNSVIEDASPSTATGNVLTNDTGGVAAKTVTAVNGNAASVGQSVNGQFGTFVINANGAYTYTLNNSNTTVNALNSGQTLMDSINYTAGDGTTTDVGTLTVTIQGNTDGPVVAVDDTNSVIEDASPNTATGNVLTNDTGGVAAKTVTAVNGNAASVGQSVNGQFGTFVINANGTYTYTLNNSNNTVNALNSGQALMDSINYTAGDGTTTDVGTLTITINGNTDAGAVDATNDTGMVTEDDATTTATGNVLTNDSGSGTLTVTAVNGNTASVGQTVNGQFGTFVINANGTFTYTLDNTKAALADLNDGETATDSMTYTVGNGTTSDTATLTITINGNTDAGAVDATNDTGTVTEDDATTTSTGNVLTNDTGSGTLTVTAVNGNTASVGQTVNGQFGTFVINANGTYTYTLDNTRVALADLNDGETATDSMTYTVGNGTTSDTATLTITINGNTDAGAVDATNDTGTVTEDDATTTATGNVLTNDTGSGTLTVTAVNGNTASVGMSVPGQFGTFVINANGTFTYTLDNNDPDLAGLNDDETVTDSMTYTVGNGTTSDIGTLTITINGNTDAGDVDATNDTGMVTEDDATPTATGNVLTNDTGSGTLAVTAVNGNTASVGMTVNGQFGTFVINADGTFTYTLNNNDPDLADLNDGETAIDSMTYTVGNGTTSDVGTLNITINGNTDAGAVVAGDDTNGVTEDDATNTATGSVFPNDTGSGTLLIVGVNGTEGNVGMTVNGQFGTFVLNQDGSYTYTLNNNDPDLAELNDGETAIDSIDYTVSNGTTSDTATLTITINGNTDAGAVDATNDTGTVTEDDATTTATGNVLTNDTGSGTLAVTAVNGNAASVGMSVPGQFGTFVINANGTYTYTLDNNDPDLADLNDGETATDSMTYTVGNGTTSDNATLTITITGNTDAGAVVADDDTDDVTEDATPNTATGSVLTNDMGSGTLAVTAVDGVPGDVGMVVNGQFGTFQINSDGTYTYTLDNNNTQVNDLDDDETLTDSIDYTAGNGTTTDIGTLTITIQGTTELAATNDAATVVEDDSPPTATGNVLTNDDGGPSAKTVTAVEGGTVGQVVNGQFGTFVINADGTFTYTLDNNNPTVQALDNGGTLMDEIDYTVTSGLSTDTATLTITIEGHTELVADDDAGAVTEDDASNMATGDLLANDTGGNGAKAVTAVEGGTVGQTVQGQFGTFTILADGTFTYELDNSNAALQDLNTGETLTDEIDYTVSDDVTTDVATLIITITGNTDSGAVVAMDDPGSVTEDDATNTSMGDVLANDSGSAALTVTAVGGVPGDVGQVVNGQFGTFQINMDGTFTYTLDNANAALADLDTGEMLTDSIDYTSSDGTTSDIGTLTITINGNTDP